MREDFTTQASQLKEKGIEIRHSSKRQSEENLQQSHLQKATEYSSVAMDKATEYSSVAKDKASEYNRLQRIKEPNSLLLQEDWGSYKVDSRTIRSAGR